MNIANPIPTKADTEFLEFLEVQQREIYRRFISGNNPKVLAAKKVFVPPPSRDDYYKPILDDPDLVA